MAAPHPSTMLSVSSSSSHLQSSASSTMALRVPSALLLGLKGPSRCFKSRSCTVNIKPNQMMYRGTRLNISCAINMAAGQSGDPEKINFDYVVNKARKFWDSAPQPLKSFPWNRAFQNFIQILFDLTVAVVKYLCAPVLFVSSLSEMSYCAHQRKLFLVPFPLLIGVAVAGVLRETAVELSPALKDAEVPWHLIAIALFFCLMKLLGPYYPYWGRMFIPHLANGALLRTLWSVLAWYRRPKTASGATVPQSLENNNHSETKQL